MVKSSPYNTYNEWREAHNSSLISEGSMYEEPIVLSTNTSKKEIEINDLLDWLEGDSESE